MSADSAAETSPATKRKRSDLDDALNESNIRSEVWFDDGNIVLQAENVQFKFYKGLLATYSPFFKDAFAIPQPQLEQDSDTVDGCQIMRLPDSAADVEYMLSFLLEPKSSLLTPSIADVASALRLSHKYIIPGLWEDAVARLRYEFPDSLEQYIERREVLPGTHTRIRFEQWQRLLHLVDTLQAVGLHRTMAMIYFRIADTSNVDTLTSGAPRVPRLESASIQSRCTLLGGRAKLLAASMKCIRMGLADPSPEPANCPDPQACGRRRRLLQGKLFARFESDTNIALLMDWPKFLPRLQGPSICDACLLLVRQRREAELQATWQKLPSFFGLPAWEELKDFELRAHSDT
ncbi:hypothetical protein EV121DRAFT_283046 [Schizophyllum commune]